MAIDSSASVVATSALQSIPFGTLIGGPLNAAIEAQANAAKTTVDFIQAVGFNTDASGNKTAVTIAFQYDRAGQSFSLSVPVLALVPVPFIAVDVVSIDFKASISASAASSQSDQTTTEKNASLNVTARAGTRFWGASTSFNASYSSKKDSKSTQESKYSVEYTIDVHVQAKQESMPAGLATLLGILTSAITEKPALTPGANVTVGDSDTTSKQRHVQVKVVNDVNNAVANATVKFTLAADPDAGSYKLSGQTSPVSVITDADGVAAIDVQWTGTNPPTQGATQHLDVEVTAGTTTFTKKTVDVTYKP